MNVEIIKLLGPIRLQQVLPWTTFSSCLAARCAPTAVRAATTSQASRSQVEVRKEFNPPLLANPNPIYRHAIAAALFLLPCSCAQASLRMTKLFHAWTKLFHASSLQLGIVSLFHRYRLTSLITSTAPQPIGLRVGGNLRRAMSCTPSIITVIGLLHD